MTKKEFLKNFQKHYGKCIIRDENRRNVVAGGSGLGWIIGSGILLGTRLKTVGWIVSTVSGLMFMSVMREDILETAKNVLSDDFEDDTSFDPEEDE